MNERIKQLAEQCWVHTNEPLYSAKSPHWEFDRHKFAELIIQECAEVCRKQSMHYAEHNNQGSSSSAADVCRILINQHFGVENERIQTKYDDGIV